MSGTDARRQCPCGRCQTTTGRRADIVAVLALTATGAALIVTSTGGWGSLLGIGFLVAAGVYGLVYVGDGSE